MEERAPGIEVEQAETLQTQLERLIDEILERKKDAKRELDSKDREQKSKADKEKAITSEPSTQYETNTEPSVLRNKERCVEKQKSQIPFQN